MKQYIEQLVELSKIDKAIDAFTPKMEAVKARLEQAKKERDELAKRLIESMKRLKSAKSSAIKMSFT